jgi:ADP-ribose pyrophosphatase YjhB (NUDIX family)
MIGFLAGIGGKVDLGEELDDALDREFLEEVGIDISGMRRLPVDILVDGDVHIVTYLIYSPTELAPVEKEPTKVAAPQWYPALPPATAKIWPPFRATLTKAAALRGSALSRNGALGADEKWLWRPEEPAGLPPGYDPYEINNTDSLCCAYAIETILGLWGGYEAVRARFGPIVGKYGFSPSEILDLEKYPCAVWDVPTRRWTGADPNAAAVHLMWSSNGDGGHYDALKPAANPTLPQRTTLYINGRGALYRKGTSGLSLPQGEQEGEAVETEEVTDVVAPNRAMTFKLPPGFSLASATNVLSGVLRPAATALVGGDDGPTYYGFNNSLATATRDVRDYIVTWEGKEELFYDFAYNYDYKKHQSGDRVQGLLSMLYSDAISNGANIRQHPGCGNVDVNWEISSGSSTHTVSARIDTTVGAGTRHREVVSGNTLGASYSERHSSLTNDLKALYSRFFAGAPHAAARLANFATTHDEAPGAKYTSYYERLISGYLLTEQEVTQPRPFHVPAPVPPGVNNMLPLYVTNSALLLPDTPAAMEYIIGEQVAAPVNLVGAPTLQPVNGFTGVSIFPIRRFAQEVTPRIDAINNNDWRGPLSVMHLAHMGLRRADDYVDAAIGLNLRDVTLDSPLTAPYVEQIPALVLMAGFPILPQGQAAILHPSLANPASWRSAIAFMLHTVGHTAEFLLAWQNVARRMGRFYTAEIKDLPTAWPDRTTDGQAMLTVLRRRLIAMRIIRPAWSGLPAAVRANPGWVAASRMWHAVQPAAPLTHHGDVAANQAAVDAAMGNAAGQANWAAANTLPFVPVVANLAGNNERLLPEAIGWHQFFSQVNVLDDEEFQQFTRGMMTSQMSQVRLWLAQDFNGMFNPFNGAVVLPNAAVANYWSLADPLSMRGGAANIPFRRSINGGQLWNRAHNLPTTNLIETFKTAIPSGCSRLRASRVDADYPQDSSAIHVAARFNQLPPSQFYLRTAFMAIQMRAVADGVTCVKNLNAHAIGAAYGNPASGSPLYDAWLMRSSARDSVGGFNAFLREYISLWSAGVDSLGYPAPLIAYWEGQVTNLDLIPAQQFDSAPHLQWRCFHPVIVNSIAPDINLTGGLIAKEVKMMSVETPEEELPWDKFYVKIADKTELAGYLRVAMLSGGYTLRFRPSYHMQLSRSGQPPQVVRLLNDLDDIAPRISDSAPWTTTASQDPYWYYRVRDGLKYQLDVPGPVNGRFPFMKPVYMFGYLNSERIHSGAPIVTTDAVRILRERPVAGNFILPGNGTSINFNPGQPALRQPFYAGMNAGNYSAYYRGGATTREHAASLIWFSRQRSQNAVFMRSFTGLMNSCDAATAFGQMLAANLLATPNAAGAIPPAPPVGNAGPGYNFGAYPEPIRNARSSALLTIVFRPNDIPAMPVPPPLGVFPTGRSNPHLRLFYDLWSTMQARNVQWFMSMSIDRPIVQLSYMEPMPIMAANQVFDPSQDTPDHPGALNSGRFIASLTSLTGAGNMTIDSKKGTVSLDLSNIDVLTAGHTDRPPPPREVVTFAPPVFAPMETTTSSFFNSGMSSRGKEREVSVPFIPKEPSEPPIVDEATRLRQAIELVQLRRQLADLEKPVETPKITPPDDGPSERLVPAGKLPHIRDDLSEEEVVAFLEREKRGPLPGKRGTRPSYARLQSVHVPQGF